ncbi:MAG TPA: 2-dehydropantoate 2-reductase [Phycisphaerales bacterium]|nr:2-dehydropantoate 2-reductase [Phycisphaerales bacterium]
MAHVSVIGPGAIGCQAAAAVQRAGRHELSICSRRPLPTIKVEQRGEPPLVLSARIVTDPSAVHGPADLVILAVKAHQTVGAAAWLSRLCAAGTLLAVLQNGVEHVQRVAPYCGAATILPVVVHCSALMHAPEVARSGGPLRLIAPDGPGAARLVAALRGSGARIETTGAFVTEAWTKLCWNAVAGLMAAAAAPAVIFCDASVRERARRLALETIRVGRAEGARIDDAYADELIAGFAALPPASGTSILTDRLAGRPLEWDARNGVVQRLGARHGVPTPETDSLVEVLAAVSG